MGTAATLGLLDLSMLLSESRLLHPDGLFLDGLGIRLTLLSNGATEALLLGAALRIALATPAKAAATRLGGKGTHDVLIEQLVGIDMLARSTSSTAGTSAESSTTKSSTDSAGCSWTSRISALMV